MTTPFAIVIMHLEKLGFFGFLPFLLSLAAFYGLLKRSKIFGEPEKNVAVNATVATVAAFMIWAYPFLNGVGIEQYEMMISGFFFNSLIATLIIIFGLLIAGMFFPEGLGKGLSEKFKGGGFWGGVILLGILIALIVFFSSSISGVFFPTGIGVSTDLLYSIGVLVVLVIVVGLVVWFTGKEETKPKS